MYNSNCIKFLPSDCLMGTVYYSTPFRHTVNPSFRPPPPPLCMQLFLHLYISISLKLYRCLGHGLKTSILLEYNPQIILSLFSQNELSRFLITLNRYQASCVYNSSLSFMLIPLKLYLQPVFVFYQCIIF